MRMLHRSVSFQMGLLLALFNRIASTSLRKIGDNTEKFMVKLLMAGINRCEPEPTSQRTRRQVYLHPHTECFGVTKVGRDDGLCSNPTAPIKVLNRQARAVEEPSRTEKSGAPEPRSVNSESPTNFMWGELVRLVATTIRTKFAPMGRSRSSRSPTT